MYLSSEFYFFSEIFILIITRFVFILLTQIRETYFISSFDL